MNVAGNSAVVALMNSPLFRLQAQIRREQAIAHSVAKIANQLPRPFPLPVTPIIPVVPVVPVPAYPTVPRDVPVSVPIGDPMQGPPRPRLGGR